MAKKRKTAQAVTHSRKAEIVQDIVRELGRLKYPRSQVTAHVGQGMEMLCKTAPVFKKLADRRANRIHAEKLDRALLNVEKLIESSPDKVKLSLFYPHYPPSPISTGIEDVSNLHQNRVESFIGEIRRLRQVCHNAIKLGYGSHPNTDTEAHGCASLASALMLNLSHEKPSSSSDKSRLRQITSLLYEAVTGEVGRDLARACNTVRTRG